MTGTGAQCHYLFGTLLVTPAEYWFTAGGEKGSFGYYPHLKDRDDYPIYPDTQLHGDIRMAAGLVQKDEKIINKYFGKESKKEDSHFVVGNSKLFVSDLELTDSSKVVWDKNRKQRMEVEPRIQIDDDARTVERHFYADLELAWFGRFPEEESSDQLQLEAEFCLGPFDSAGESNTMKDLVENALKRLSGFGAFRSRGYSQGALSLETKEPLCIKPVDTDKELLDVPGGLVTYALKALFNVRNRPIDPGSAQIVDTSHAITPAQLKGWFARAYSQLYSKPDQPVWPTPQQMELIELATLRPTWDADVVTYAPPMTTLINGNFIHDKLAPSKDKGEESENFEGENFFATKPKTLGEGWYVTSLKETFHLPVERRMRNSMENNFTTKKENGLFSQEYLPRGVIFSGVIAVKNPDKKHTEFVSKAWHILTKHRPAINGALFEPHHGVMVHTGKKHKRKDTPWLLTEPVRFDNAHHAAGNCVTIGSERGYNTTLKRPRRPQIMTLPGSIVKSAKEIPLEALNSWPGFNQPLYREYRRSVESHRLLAINLAYISDAQFGQLRGLKSLPEKYLRANLDKRIGKYKNSGKEPDLLVLLKRIRSELDDSYKSMTTFIDELLEAKDLQNWDSVKEAPTPNEQEEEAL